jgi:hypothetical protein
MAATYQWSEANGSGETVTDGISNMNFGDTDAANLTPASYPIVAGNNSYEKDIKAKFSGTFTEISNMKFWKSAGAYVTGEDIKADQVTSYVQPVKTTSTRAVTTIPTTEGTALAILSAAGTTTITAAGYSRYICLQLQTTVSTPAGAVNQKEFTFQYDEV